MYKWISSACLLAFIAQPAAAADVRLDSYRNPQNQRTREFGQLYLDGVRSGLMAYNSLVQHHGGEPAFCMPGELVLSTVETERVMLRAAEKRSAKGDMLVSILLLSGLRDTFPCEKSKNPT